jgi:predicted AAA+ superfamily ATPase
VVGRKMKKAQRKANAHLKRAEKLISEGGNVFYDEIFAALYGYIRDRLNMGISELSKQQIKERFKDKKINSETIEELISVLETCEMARFAPIGDVSRKELVVQARKVINQIEKQVG